MHVGERRAARLCMCERRGKAGERGNSTAAMVNAAAMRARRRESVQSKGNIPSRNDR